MFDPDRPGRGYALLWPRDLFRDELASVTELLRDSDLRPALRTLFEESLRGPDPIEDLDRLQPTYAASTADGWPIESNDNLRELGREIFKHLGALPAYMPRRYYLARHAPPDEPPLSSDGEADWADVRQAWVQVVEDLVDHGYLDRLAGDSCGDGQGSEQQALNIARLVEDHCGLAGQWPLNPVDEESRQFEEEVFFTLVEVFHDLVARPRVRSWHEFDGRHCWTSEFDDRAGQAVYRWKVNDLLDRHGVGLQLAATGEDHGFLVNSPADPRRELVEQVRTASAGNADRVDHAIALFRKRDATGEDKRSACAALANVLEDRRKSVLKQHLTRDDESPLFEIANKFGIRHHRNDQMYGYDEAFLDWIFWWYLATVELTNRLITRAAGQS